MIEPRNEQLKAIGNPVKCKPAEPLASTSHAPASLATESSPAPSVVVVDPDKPAWIGLQLIDRKKRPVPGAAWEVVLPNGKTVTGALDRNGRTRLEGIDPGQCKVTFPALDRREFL